MIHRSYRSLDEPPRLIGFTTGQWMRLVALGTLVIGLVLTLHLPVKIAVSTCAVAIGLPAALTYVSEPGGVRWGRLLLDAARWNLATRRLEATRTIQPSTIRTR